MRIIDPENAYNEAKERFRQFRRDNPGATELVWNLLAQSEVHELKSMVEKGASERDLDSFIQGEPNLLSALLEFAGTGHHGGRAYPQQTIRPHVPGAHHGLIPDYLISGDSSDGLSWWVIELKSPSHSLFSGKGHDLRFSDKANRGITQLLRYIEFCKSHQTVLRESLSLDNFRDPSGILLIGREAEFIDQDRQMLKRAWNSCNSKLKIRTWDSFIRSLESKLTILGRSKKESL